MSDCGLAVSSGRGLIRDLLPIARRTALQSTLLVPTGPTPSPVLAFRPIWKGLDAQDSGDAVAHGIVVIGKFWPFGRDDAVQIHNVGNFARTRFAAGGKHLGRVAVAVGWISVREHDADIGQRGGSQQARRSRRAAARRRRCGRPGADRVARRCRRSAAGRPARCDASLRRVQSASSGSCCDLPWAADVHVVWPVRAELYRSTKMATTRAAATAKPRSVSDYSRLARCSIAENSTVTLCWQSATACDKPHLDLCSVVEHLRQLDGGRRSIEANWPRPAATVQTAGKMRRTTSYCVHPRRIRPAACLARPHAHRPERYRVSSCKTLLGTPTRPESPASYASPDKQLLVRNNNCAPTPAATPPNRLSRLPG